MEPNGIEQGYEQPLENKSVYKLGKILNKYLILELLGYSNYSDEARKIMSMTSTIFRILIIRNYKAASKILSLRDELSINLYIFSLNFFANAAKLLNRDVVEKDLSVSIDGELALETLVEFKNCISDSRISLVNATLNLISERAAQLELLNIKSLIIRKIKEPFSLSYTVPERIQTLELEFVSNAKIDWLSD